MKVLVLGNVHPNEAHASQIWKALKEEINNPDIIFDRVPFEMTIHGYLNKFLKLLFTGTDIEKRFREYKLKIKDKKFIETGRHILQILRQDLFDHKPWYKANISRIYSSWYNQDEVSLGDFIEIVLPETLDISELVQDNSPLYQKFLAKHKVDVGIDIHNASFKDGSSWKPYILTVGNVLGSSVIELLSKYQDPKLPIKREDYEFDRQFVTIEVPAQFSGSRFVKYSWFGTTELSWGMDAYIDFAKPYLQYNRRHFQDQKEIVKNIIFDVYHMSK